MVEGIAGGRLQQALVFYSVLATISLDANDRLQPGWLPAMANGAGASVWNDQERVAVLSDCTADLRTAKPHSDKSWGDIVGLKIHDGQDECRPMSARNQK